MRPVTKEKGRSRSPTGSSPSKITQENKTLKQEVEEAKRNLAMLQESYERYDQGGAMSRASRNWNVEQVCWNNK